MNEEGLFRFFGLLVAITFIIIATNRHSIRCWWEEWKKERERRKRESQLLARIFAEMVKIAREDDTPAVVRVSMRSGGFRVKICAPMSGVKRFSEIRITDTKPDGRPWQTRYYAESLTKSGLEEKLLLVEIELNLYSAPERAVCFSGIHAGPGVRFFRLDQLDEALDLARRTFAKVSFV